MKTHILLFVLTILFVPHLYGQNRIKVHFKELNKIIDNDNKTIIKNISDIALVNWYQKSTIFPPETSITCIDRFELFQKWQYNRERKFIVNLRKTYQLSVCQFELFILIMYHYHLNRLINNDEQYNKYRNDVIQLIKNDIKIRQQNISLYKERIKLHLDSILPNNFRDTFTLLDMELSDSLKYTFKNYTRDSLIDFHHSFGAWIRNRFNLWGYSPLKNYIVKIEGYENPEYIHPDRASEIILYFYHDWLNGKHERWQKWEQEKDPMKRNQLLWGERDKE